MVLLGGAIEGSSKRLVESVDRVLSKEDGDVGEVVGGFPVIPLVEIIDKEAWFCNPLVYSWMECI